MGSLLHLPFHPTNVWYELPPDPTKKVSAAATAFSLLFVAPARLIYDMMRGLPLSAGTSSRHHFYGGGATISLLQ